MKKKIIIILIFSISLYGGTNPVQTGVNFMNDFRSGAIATKSTINFNRKKFQSHWKKIIKEDYKKSKYYFKKIKKRIL